MASVEEVSMIDKIYFGEIAENLQNKIVKEKQIINGIDIWEELLASLQNQDETTEEVTHNLFRIMLNLISDKEIKEGFSDKIKEIFNDFFERNKPIPNNVVENEGQYYFCPNLTQGLACIGYFFARFYDPNKFKSIPKSLLFPSTEESQ
jgi:hypothetical protein